MSADMRPKRRPSLRAEPKLRGRSEAGPPKPPERLHRRLLTALIVFGGFAFTVGGFVLGAFAFVGPPWPTEPTFEPGAPSFGSAFDVTFSGTNKSLFFDNRNLRVSCTLVCFKYTGPTGATIRVNKNSNANIAWGVGPDRLKADDTLPFICRMRNIFNVDGKDVADGLPTVAISFKSEYDNPWWLWFRRKTVQSTTFSLNTKATPPQWVRGELPGLCDF
jgi:hypothetical protein